MILILILIRRFRWDFFARMRSSFGAGGRRRLEWVVPQFGLADEELVRLVHSAGKRIMVWTVNRAERMREFAQWGVDAIISDETELLVRSLR